MMILQLAAFAFTAAVFSLSLRREQPAFAFLISMGTAVVTVAVVLQRLQPLLEQLGAMDHLFQGIGAGCLLRVLGIALAAQFAADTCREAGMTSAAGVAELAGRTLALLQVLPLVQGLFDSLSSCLR